MSERLQPGKNPTSPVVLVRGFTRDILTRQGEPDNFIKASVEFADAAFYIERGVGHPDYHLELATKKAKKLGLSAEDINRAIQTAQGVFAAYWQLSRGDSPTMLNDSDTETIQNVLEIRRRALEEQRERVRQERVQRKKNLLEERFQRLMQYSDAEISILNANPRIDFASDPVYPKLNRANRDKMRARTLTEVEYENGMVEILVQKDILTLRVDHTYDLSKLPAYIEGINRDLPLKESLGEQKFLKLVAYVNALIAGERVSKAQILRDGLQSETVFTKARNILARFYINEADRARIMNNPLPSELTISTRRGVDPQVFLEDGSHRRALGYIQGQQELKE